MSSSTSHSNDQQLSSAISANTPLRNGSSMDPSPRHQHQHPLYHHHHPSRASKRSRFDSETDVASLSSSESLVNSPSDSYSIPSPAPHGGDAECRSSVVAPSSPMPPISHTLLHQAISQGDLSLLDSLLQTLASSSLSTLQSFVNAFNSDGQTLLTHACMLGNAKMVRLLVNHGADIRQTNRDGWAPAHIASFKGSFEIMMFLMNCGRRRPNYGHLNRTVSSRPFARPESPVESEANVSFGAHSSSTASSPPSSPHSLVDAQPDTPMSSPATPQPVCESVTPTRKRRRTSSSSRASSNHGFDSFSSFASSYMPFSPASPATPDESCLKDEDSSSASSCQQQQQCLTRISATSIYPNRQSLHRPHLEVQTSLPASLLSTRTSAVTTSLRPKLLADTAPPKGRTSDGRNERDVLESLSTAASPSSIAPLSPASWTQTSDSIRLLEPPPSPAESEHELTP